MPDLAPALPTKRFDLTGRVWREVVMMHIALGFGWAKSIQFLRFAQGAERCKRQDLSLTACEQARSMGTRRNTYLTPNGADLGRGTAIRAFAHAQDALAHDGLFSQIKSLLNRSRGRKVLRYRSFR